MVRENYLISCADINLKYLRICRDIAATMAIYSRGEFRRFCDFDNAKVHLEVLLKECICSLEGYSHMSSRYVSELTLDAEKHTRQMTGIQLCEQLTDFEIDILGRQNGAIGRLPTIFSAQQSIMSTALACVSKLNLSIEQYIADICSGNAYSGCSLSLLKTLLIMSEYYHKALIKFCGGNIPDFGEPELHKDLFNIMAKSDISYATMLGDGNMEHYRTYFAKSVGRCMYEFRGETLPIVADIALRFVF